MKELFERQRTKTKSDICGFTNQANELTPRFQLLPMYGNVIDESRRHMPLTTKVQYTNLPGNWGGLMSQRRSGVSSFVLPDMQGHTRLLTDINGNVTDTFTPNAWGELKASTGNTVTPYKSFGQWGYFTESPSRQYVRERQLRNDLGRWVSRDPLGFAFSLQTLYGYALPNPLTQVDPTGLVCEGIASHYGELPSDQGCLGGCKHKVGTTKVRCKDRKDIPCEPCNMTVCVEKGQSGMIGAIWNERKGEYGHAALCSDAQCWSRAKVERINPKTGQVLSSIEVAIVDTGTFCSAGDPGCRRALEENNATWPGKKRIIDLHKDAWKALGVPSKDDLVAVRVTGLGPVIIDLIPRICFSSEHNAESDCRCQDKRDCFVPSMWGYGFQ